MYQEFKGNLNYVATLKPAWAIGEAMSNHNTPKRNLS